MTVTRGLKNPASLPTSTALLLGRILARGTEKTAVLAMGNPYLSEDFPGIQNYICTFSNATVSEVSAARALFGEIPLQGHLPVSIHNASLRSAGNLQPVNGTYSPSWHLSPASMPARAIPSP